MSHRDRRTEEGKQDVLSDAIIYLQSSQSHVRPTRPEVAELIEKELRWGTELIAHAGKVCLIVGHKSIEAVHTDEDSASTVAIEPGAKLAIEGVFTNEDTDEKRIIIVPDDKQPLHLLPDVLAATLVEGGEILGPEDKT